MSSRWLIPVLAVAMVVFALVVFDRLPAEVPVHFDWNGETDVWMARWPGAFLLPAIALGLWLLLPVLRRIDPRRANYERFNDTWWLLLNVITLLLVAIHLMVLGVGLGWPVDMSRAPYVLLGLLFIGLGNYLPRLRSNWWMGIRTPWTLDSERVWRDTHRLGGRTFVIGGLLVLVAAVLPPWVREWFASVVLGNAVIIPVVYSYFAYRRERATTVPSSPDNAARGATP